MKIKKTAYNSLEKDYTRKNSWIGVLKRLLKGKNEIRLLEMVGDTPFVWWGELKRIFKNRSFEVSGITMNDSIRNRGKYVHVYVGRYDKLLKSDKFLKSFPYNFINLDYYGGGSWFNEKYQYDKIPDVFKTIKYNISFIDDFYLALTIDINDKVYPWFKAGNDIILGSAIKKEVEFFLNKLENPDYWNLWLALIGNCLSVSKTANELKCRCGLVYPPYTYIGESAGHKSRMISYLFYIRKGSKRDLYKNEMEMLRMMKKTKFIKWMKNTGKIVVRKNN